MIYNIWLVLGLALTFVLGFRVALYWANYKHEKETIKLRAYYEKRLRNKEWQARLQ